MTVRIKVNGLRRCIIFLMVSMVVVLSAESVWLSNNPTVFYACAFVVLGIAALRLFNRKLSRIQIDVILAYWLLGLLYMLINGRGSLTGWGLFCVCFPLCFLIHFQLNEKEEIALLKVFVFTVSIIASISIFFWFTASVLGIVSPSGVFTIEWGGYRVIPSYFNLYFVTQGAHRTLGPWSVTARNSAVFSEAPVASFVFSLALLINMFRCKYKPKLCNTILLAAIMSTYSTTGWIVLVLIAVSYVFNYRITTKAGMVFKYLIVAAGIGITVYLVDTLLGQKMMSASGVVRMGNLREEFEAFQHSWLFGHGMGAYTYGSSNSVTALLADGGVIIWGFYFVPIILTIVRKLRTGKIDFFTIIFACMFAVTVIHYTLISIFIITMLWRSLLDKQV